MCDPDRRCDLTTPRPASRRVTTANHSNHRKGTTVINTEHSSKAPHSTGIFAALRAFLRLKGCGASSPTLMLTTLATIGAALLAGVGLMVALPATASAYATIEGPPIYSSAPGLPDGRVYEQVSPTDKNGNQAGSTTNPFITGAAERYGYAAPDGNSVLFEGTGPMGESPSPTSLQFVAQRLSTGWSTRALEPAQHHGGASVETLDAADALALDPSTDLSHAMVQTGNGYTLASSLPNEACSFQLYLTGPDPLVASTWLQQPAPATANPIVSCVSGKETGAPVGGTPNFSTVYFTSPDVLLPEDASRAPHAAPKGQAPNPYERGEVEAWGFYEYREGVLHEAGVLPDGSPDPFGAVPAASGHGKALAGNQVSASGLRAFFVSPDPASCEQNPPPLQGHNDCASDPPELYLRENGEKTLLVSRDTLLPEAGGLPASAPNGVSRMPNPTYQGGGIYINGFSGSYVFASPDGSQAFFQSEDKLTADAPEGPPGSSSAKTYDFDVDTGTLTYLPNVAGEIVAIDTDGSAFAFVRPLAGGKSAELDLWSASSDGGTVTPVTQLPTEGVATGEARMSADGSVLVFETSSRLSSAFNSGGAVQIYRYDVPANALGCVSCPPHGVTPRGDASFSALQASETYAKQTATIKGVVDGRGISSNGDRIFFDSPAPLVPQDTNTNAPEVEIAENTFEGQGRDVYEWENGVVYLISGGKSPRNSLLLDNSENGDDVFFATTESLVPGDTDAGYDVYDARVPHPGDSRPPAAVPCEGAACQGPPNVPSPLTSPASATFSGLGNPAPESVVTPPPPKQTATKAVKCKKHYVKKKNQCIEARSKKAKKASADRRAK
jgi:hypothetical protein